MTDTPEFMNLVQELKGLIREESSRPWHRKSRIEASQALE